MENYQEFFSFMSEYADLFEDVAEKEEEKFKALYSRDLTKIEGVLTEHQKTEKSINEYEIKRIELNKKLGFGDKTFKEIIDGEDGQQKSELLTIYNRLNSSVKTTKIYNEKSLEFAKMNLEIIEEIKSNIDTNAHCYDAKGSTKVSSKEKPAFFNAKI